MTKLSIKQFIKHFINKYRQKRIDYQPKTFEKNDLTIAVNILYIKEKEISPVYISKTNSNFEKKNYYYYYYDQPNEEKEGWHYIKVKKLHY